MFLLTALLLISTPLFGQAIQEFVIPIPNSGPFWLSRGADGAMWFTMSGSRAIGRMTADGAMSAHPIGGETPQLLARTNDGTLLFTMANSSQVGALRPDGGLSFAGSPDPSAIHGIAADAQNSSWWVTTGGGKVMNLGANQVLREATVPPNGGPLPVLSGIAISSDGLPWFADQRAGAPRLGRVLIGGSFLFPTVILIFVDLPVDSVPVTLTAGDNGAIWFTDYAGFVGRVTREGAVTRIAVPHAQSEPLGITRGADGAIWFTESGANRIGRIDPLTLALTEIVIPTPNSRPAGIALGADSAIWFAERVANKIGRIGTPSAGADLAVTIESDPYVDLTPYVMSFPPKSKVTVRNIGTAEARDVMLSVSGSGRLTPEGICEDLNPCPLGTIASGGATTIEFSNCFCFFNSITKQIDFFEPPTGVHTDASVTTSSNEQNLGNNDERFVTQLVDCEALATCPDGSDDCLIGECPILGITAAAICVERANASQTPAAVAKHSSSRGRSLIRTLADEVLGLDLDVFYGMRDQVLARTAAGRRYTELYYTHGREISRILLFNPTVGAQAFATLRAWQEPLRALVNGAGSSVSLTPAQIAALQTVLDSLKQRGSSELRAAIEREEGKLQLASLSGQTMSQALARQTTTTAPATITLPAAASLHGIPPAFFHSDVRVFNPSVASMSVTARYRCFSGSCGNGVQTFTVAPGEMKVFDDMVARQFGAPESGGAIEFEGDVIVDSRLYTPEAGAPTTGMYVPALNAGSAFAESVLLSLSNAADPSRGFRTNVGVYNPNDLALDVLFIVYDRLGREIGRTTRSLPARTPVQVNNIFAAVGAAGDFDGAYCVIRADGIRELFAYASVIDNQSQDLIFVTGRNHRHGSLTTATLPAAASLHGIPPSFFHSDVTVFNPSPTQSAHVTARYRCFIGSCGSGSTSFEVAPGEARVFEDAPLALFGAPESGGAIEFEGPVLIDSRLYTPSRPAPSTGMYVPAAQDDDAHAESVLLSLSHAADQSRGFRTNAGAYNPNPVALDVTFTLFDPTGKRLGEVTRQVPARTPVQVNNVFAVAGITIDVPSAYCVVRADGIHPLFAFASVIDNRSQDLIFVRGSRRHGL